jgi:hypothetical protein
MLIAIPSKGRAGRVKTLKILKNGVLFVPEYERDDYVRVYGERVVGVPSSVKGITATRNWVLDNCNDDWVVMVDDDVKVQGYFRLFESFAKTYSMTSEQWEREFIRMFDLTEQMNYRIWGVNTDGSLKGTFPYKPINFRTYVTASMMGIRNDTGIRFDERFKVKEDYEICLRCIKEDGGLAGIRYVYWVNSHWEDEGGCKDYRTHEVEEQAIEMLIKMYPGFIHRIARKNSEYTVSLSF